MSLYKFTYNVYIYHIVSIYLYIYMCEGLRQEICPSTIHVDVVEVAWGGSLLGIS